MDVEVGGYATPPCRLLWRVRVRPGHLFELHPLPAVLTRELLRHYNVTFALIILR